MVGEPACTTQQFLLLQYLSYWGEDYTSVKIHKHTDTRDTGVWAAAGGSYKLLLVYWYYIYKLTLGIQRVEDEWGGVGSGQVQLELYLLSLRQEVLEQVYLVSKGGGEAHLICLHRGVHLICLQISTQE